MPNKNRGEFFHRYRYGLAAFLFIFLILGKFHGSSLTLWSQWIGSSQVNPLLGKARDIRTDEYLFQTPLYLAQTQTKPALPFVNSALGSTGTNMLLALYAPGWYLATVGKPMNWGFLFLGRDYGFSWYWFSKLILLFLFSYELSLILTGGKRAISCLGAAWISFSPFIQWWFSTAFVDLILYFEGLLVCLYHGIFTRYWQKRLVMATLSACLGIGFALTFYPTFQIILGLVILGWGILWLRQAWTEIKITRWEKYGIGICGLFLLAVVSYSVYESWAAIEIVRHTAYPGAQRIHPWQYPLTFLQLYLFNWRIPFNGSYILNECEASTFVNFLPAVLAAAPMLFTHVSRMRRVALALLLYTLFLVSWLVIDYPDFISRWTLFSLVSSNRIHFLIGLLGVYLSLWALAAFHSRPLASKWIILIVVGVIYVSAAASASINTHLNLTVISCSVVFLLFTNWALLAGRVWWFSLGILVFSVIPGLWVNPLNRGLGVIYEQPISQKIKTILAADPAGKWAGVGEVYTAQLLMSLGAHLFNGAQWYPDLPMWESLDPSGQYRPLYNRYAYVDCALGGNATRFETLASDHFRVQIAVKDLNKTGIKYFLSQGKLIIPHLRLKLLDSVEKNKLYLYQLESPDY